MTQRPLTEYALLFVKGMTMGAGDIVPGVSGGTIAFITGIYEELIDSLRRIDQKALKVLLTQGPIAAWKYINGFFLLAVFGGVLTSIATLANVLAAVLESHPILIWSFFFGLVLASAIYIARQLPGWTLERVLILLIGIGLAYGVSIVKPAELPGDWWVVALAGSVAICAMILPGVSGSFLLVLMGLYPTILGAISDVNVVILGSFLAGCVVGLLFFSHLLHWLLQRFHELTLALLTGFLLGSLTMLWPWKATITSYVDRHGVVKPLIQQNISPQQFSTSLGQESHLVLAIISAVVGLLLVLGLEFISSKNQAKSADS
ncbi:DUF368 domain-containing protein [Aurantivibrio plasticivorans]